jgi:hypothetical protein
MLEALSLKMEEPTAILSTQAYEAGSRSKGEVTTRQG